MKRLLALWLALIASFWVARMVISVSLFSNVDLTIRSFMELVIVPGVQAAVVAWATRSRGGSPLFGPWRQALTRPVLRFALAVDLLLLLGAAIASRFAGGGTVFGFASLDGLPRLALSAKLLIAAILLVAASRSLSKPGAFAARLLAVFLATFATAVPTGWLAHAPEWLFPGQPLLGRWLRLALPLLLVLVLLQLGAQTAIGRVSSSAARAIDWALAACMLGIAILVGGFFLRPYLREPWSSMAWGAASVMSTALLVAGTLARSPAKQT